VPLLEATGEQGRADGVSRPGHAGRNQALDKEHR
jgi:hypothetical protein